MVAGRAISRVFPCKILDVYTGDSHTTVFCYYKGCLYVANKTTSVYNAIIVKTFGWIAPADMHSQLLNFDHLYPLYLDNIMTRCMDIRSSGVHTKSPNYLKHINTMHPHCFLEQAISHMRKLLRREIMVNEKLRGLPHPNIAVYHGVLASEVVKLPTYDITYVLWDLRVQGLCFKKYPHTLHDLIEKQIPFNAQKALADISAGITHLYSHNIVHCDISPNNILFDPSPDPESRDGTFVIGDFDSAHEASTPYELKGGTPPWCIPNPEIAQFDDDWHSLNKIKEWLPTAISNRSSK